MDTPCKHPTVRVVAREGGTKFVECQVCGEVFDADEIKDMVREERSPEEDKEE